MKTYYLIQMLEIGSRSLNLQNFSKTRKSIGYVPPCLCFLLSIHGWEYRKGTAEIPYLVTNERAWDDQWMTNGRSMNPILSICEESPYSYSLVNFPCNQHNEQAVGKSWQKRGSSGSRTNLKLVVQWVFYQWVFSQWVFSQWVNGERASSAGSRSGGCEQKPPYLHPHLISIQPSSSSSLFTSPSRNVCLVKLLASSSLHIHCQEQQLGLFLWFQRSFRCLVKGRMNCALNIINDSTTQTSKDCLMQKNILRIYDICGDLSTFKSHAFFCRVEWPWDYPACEKPLSLTVTVIPAW